MTSLDEIDAARREHYLLLASLLRAPPTQDVLSVVASLTGDASELGLTRIGLAQAASAADPKVVGEEFFALFIGVGRGDVLPYGSYYLTGFLNERPLARLREDLARLGVERAPGNYDPEDNLGTLFEIMAGLIAVDFATDDLDDRAFFKRHVEPWAARCLADIGLAPSAAFYKSVAAFGLKFIDIETTAFDLA